MRNQVILVVVCLFLLMAVSIESEAASAAASVQTSSISGGAEASAESGWCKGILDSFYINIIAESRWKILFEGLKATLLISLLSALLGSILGGLICFMRKSSSMILSKTARIYISLMRGTPVLVLLMIIFYVVFSSVNIDPLAVAVIAFSMNFAAYSAEIFRSGIDSIDKGQKEAGTALGFSRNQTFIYIIFPQAFLRIVPVLKGEIINLIKQTSVVGYIAVQDLTKAGDLIRSRTFDAFFPLITIAVLYFLLSWLVIKSIDFIENIYNRKKKMKSVKI